LSVTDDIALFSTFSRRLVDEFDFSSGEVDTRAYEIEPFAAGGNLGAVNRIVVHEALVYGRRHCLWVDSVA
jgi:hypothetical protein